MWDQALAFYHAGKRGEANELYEMIISPVLGSRNVESARILNNYALLLADKGDLEKAEAMHGWALEAEVKIQGDDHPAVLSCLNNISRTIMRQGRLTEAEDLFRRVLGVRIHLFGRDGYDTLRSRSNLASVVLLQGKLSAAEDMYKEMLVAQENNLEIHVDVVDTMRKLAVMLLHSGKAKEAKLIQQRAF